MADRIREGLVPTLLGTAVTAAGLAAYAAYPITGAAVAGFGLAHLVLGGIDLATHNNDETNGMNDRSNGYDNDHIGTGGTLNKR